MFKPTAVYIVDPNLFEANSHYHTQDILIAKECLKRDIPVTLFCRCAANIDNFEVSVAGVFRFDIYVERPPERPEFGVFENYFLVNRAFLQDMNAIPISELSPTDLFYFPSLTQNQIEAVSDWVLSLPADKRPFVAITLRFLNSRMSYNVSRAYTSGIEFLYRHALAKLVERHPRTCLFSDTHALSTFYNRLSGLPVITLPIPQVEVDAEYVQPRSAEMGRLTVLYIGNLSEYRGYQFIPKIIEEVLGEFPDVRFTIQVSAGLESDAAKAMVAISDTHASRVNFLFGSLSPDEYLRTMKSADIVLLPYMPEFYAYGSSGVFTEAGALGKVMAVTAGTTMETTINAFEMGAVVAPDFTAESFSEAVKTAILNFAELDQKARTSYVRFAHENSPEGFLDSMFNCIG